MTPFDNPLNIGSNICVKLINEPTNLHNNDNIRES